MINLESNAQIFYYPYTLKSNKVLNSKQQASSEGILLKWKDPAGTISYSDLPIMRSFYPEASIEFYLEFFKKVQFSFADGRMTLAEQNPIPEVLLAQWQMAQLNLERETFLNFPTNLENNYLMLDTIEISKENFNKIYQTGYKKIKLKMKSSFEENLKILMDLTTTLGFDQFQWRLDFNSAMDPELALGLIESISPDLYPFFEYIEDPCPYHATIWTQINQFIPLAIDFEIQNFLKEKFPEQVPFQFFILKPTLQYFEKYSQLVTQNNLKVIVTSSMQGPLGVFNDFLFAKKLISRGVNVDKVVGCGTLDLFDDLQPFENEISPKQAMPQIHWQNQLLLLLDQTLKELKWIQV